MEKIANIKFLKSHKGMSLRGIAKETGHCFETVQKFVQMEDFNLRPKKKHERTSKLTKYKQLIDEWLKADLEVRVKQRHTAQKIYNRLKELFKEEFNVADRSVRKYVSRRKKELGISDKVFLPLVHHPGEAQADFGEAEFIERGVKWTGFYLALSFPYSNAGFIQVFKGQNQECLLQGLKNIFEHIGGSPAEIWFDNLSAAVKQIRRDGGRDLTEGFQRFMLHHGFNSNFCNPNSGHEKGHVENKIGYSRRNFLVPVPEIKELAEYNKTLLELCDADMNREHYKKEQAIAELFTEDKAALNKLPAVEFEVWRFILAKTNGYGKVQHEGRTYSTAPSHAGSKVWLKMGASEVIILDEKYCEIIKHERLYGAFKDSMKWLPYLEVIARRPRALKYSMLLDELPSTIKGFLEEAELNDQKSALKILAKMVTQNGIESAAVAFEETLRMGVKDIDSIWANYLRLSSENSEPAFMELAEHVPELKAFINDTSVYDGLLKGGEAVCNQ